MDQRAEYLFQILDKIGSPLMAAIIETSKGSDAECAQALASMLSKSVQVSIDLGQMMDINPVEIGDDSLRVGLAGLASSLVAEQMRQSASVPDEAQLKKIVTALQAVLTFSENFTPSAENAQRLKDLSAHGQVVDTHQVHIQYVMTFVPVVRAVSVFSFGQAEQKLIVEISDRLVKRANTMRLNLFPNVQNEDDQKRAELSILSALAQIYASCHEAETRKASGISEDNNAGPTLNAVWAAFDLHSSMLESLSTSLIPEQGTGAHGQGSATGGGPALATASTPPAQQPAEPSPPQVQEQPQASAPIAPPPAQPPTQPAEGNPMAMFAKPKEETSSAAPPIQNTPPADPPPLVQTSNETPVAPPITAKPPAEGNPMAMFAKPKEEVAPPAAQAPPAAPPAEQPVQNAGQQSSGGENQGGSPMSFFKKEGDE